MRPISPAHVIAIALLAGFASGCTILGLSVGADMSDRDPRGWGRSQPVDQATALARGTPVQVNLPDSGYVRGLWLGLVPPDGSAAKSREPSCLLGVGNRTAIDAQFASGKPVAELHAGHVPDTLTFALADIEDLRVPSGLSGAAKAGAATGLAIDTTVVVIVLLAAIGFWALFSAVSNP